MQMQQPEALDDHNQVYRDAARASAGGFDRQLARWLQRTLDGVAVRLVLWDGTSFYAGTTTPVGDVVVHDRRTLVGLAMHPDLYFGEGFMHGQVEVRGRLEGVVEALTRSRPLHPSRWQRLRGSLALPNTLHSARRNVHHHYDLGNDFYELWLDRQLVYTCAYFAAPEMSLEDAQWAKLDLVCRKLRLRPGETVVEAGCGWGALALHMARYYGVRVKAFNISREQIAFARDVAAREGLSDRVEFIDDDYRHVNGAFDAFVSVGMLEHVGLRHFRTLAGVIERVIARGGRGLLHFIGRDAPRPLNAWTRRRIFPGGYPPTLAEVVTRILTPAGMSVIDVENLRLHYARTLAHWYERYAAVEDHVRSRYGEAFQRAWALYLTGSQAAFNTGAMQLFQVVFAPGDAPPPYWARSAMYQTCADSTCTAATR
jgi:cyclopropane-fatty-acyl-phospholipid synthase